MQALELQLHSSLTGGVDELDASFTSGAPHYSFVPPAALCLSCCFYGRGRELVAVVRNPFARAHSFFKMYRRVRPNFFRRLAFVDFLDQVTHAVCLEDGTGKHVRRFWFQPETGFKETIFQIIGHLRPQATRLRYLATIREALDKKDDDNGLRDEAVVRLVHAETVSEDLEVLAATLCERHDFCEPLVPPAAEHVSTSTDEEAGRDGPIDWWSREWSADGAYSAILQEFVDCYRFDFAYLGYPRNPRRGYLPLRKKSTVNLRVLAADEELTAQASFVTDRDGIF